MSRPSLRRTPILERLETRQVLSTVGTTPDQQYALELINLVRTDPSAAAEKLTTNISPDVQATLDSFGLTVSGLKSEMDSATAQPPLAWSDALGSSAQQQSQYEADNAVQTHQGSGEASLTDRIASAGYSNVSTYGENTYAYAESVNEAMQSFLFDWGVSDHGHYNNLLQPGTSAQDSFKDVGIGLVNTGGNGVGPLVITQDFGSQQNEGPQILGAVYNDPNHTGFYAPGEGQGGVTIDAVNLTTGQDYQTQSWSSGGYQVPVASNADYQVTATENGQVISSQQVHVGDVNQQVNFVNDPSQDQASTSNASPELISTTTSVSSSTASSNSNSNSNSSGSSSQPQATPSQPTTPPTPVQQMVVTAPPRQDDASQPSQSNSAPSTPPANPGPPAWLTWSRWTASNAGH